MQDPFSSKSNRESFRRYTDIAAVTITVGSIAALATISLSQGSGPHHHAAPHVASDRTQEEGQQLVANVEHDRPNKHFHGILAVSNQGQSLFVVINPYVVPAAGVTDPQANDEQPNNDYDYFALIARKNPATGKITLTPDEILKRGNVVGGNADTGLETRTPDGAHSILQSQATLMSSTTVGNPKRYPLTRIDRIVARSSENNTYVTYSVIGNEILVPPTISITSGGMGLDKPEGLLLKANPPAPLNK